MVCLSAGLYLQRYACINEQESIKASAPRTLGRHSTSGDAGESSAGVLRGYQWRVLELLKPTAEILGNNCGALE